jgi:hypothetical protein
VFFDALKIQLIAKGIVTEDDWLDVKQKIKFNFARDNHFTELKEAEVLTNRMNLLQQADLMVGRYVSKEWVQKKILRLTDQEIKDMNKQIAAEPAPIDPNAPTTK